MTRARLAIKAFESRHRTLLDAVAGALVALLAIAFWYCAFALFNF